MHKKYKKILGNAPPEKTFVAGETELSTLGELRNTLLEQGNDFYKMYAEGENHFANWIEHVFNDKELAEKLRNTNSYTETINLLDKRINYLELWLDFNEHKEVLTNYLVEDYDKEVYEPEHHEFETLRDVNETFEEIGVKKTEQVEEKTEVQEEESTPGKIEPQSVHPPSFDGKDDITKLKELEEQLKIKEDEKTFFQKLSFLRIFKK